MLEQTHNIQQDNQFITNPPIINLPPQIPPKTPTPIDEYFHSKLSSEKREIINRNYGELVQSRLQNDLWQGKININRNQKPFSLKIVSPKTPTQEQVHLAKLAQIQSSKQKTLQQLKQIYLKQSTLLKESRQNRYKSQPRLSSNISAQDSDSLLKKALKRKYQFEERLILKNQHQMQLLQKQNNRRNQEINKNIQKRQQRKRLAIQHQLEQLKKHKEQQRLKCQSTIDFLRKFHREKDSSQSSPRSNLNIKIEQEKRRQQILQQIRRQSKINLAQDIKKHQQKYNQMMQQKRQYSQNKYAEQWRTLRAQRLVFAESTFRRRVQQQEDEKKQSIKLKVEQAQQQWKKIKDYKNYVLQNFKPKVQKKKLPQTSAQLTERLTVSSNVEQRQKGIQYLQIAKKLKKKGDSTNILPVVPKTVYKDYLKDAPKRSTINSKSHKQMLKSMISLSDPSSLIEARLFADKLQATSRKVGDDRLFYSVQNKLDILTALL